MIGKNQRVETVRDVKKVFERRMKGKGRQEKNRKEKKREFMGGHMIVNLRTDNSIIKIKKL